MRALIQRVSQASVSVDGQTLATIGPGLVVMLAVAQGDEEADAQYIVDKVVNLRIFPDDAGRFDRSALAVGADLLLISQFTLYADTRKGRRPSFTRSAPPQEAEALYRRTVELFAETGLTVRTGRFQAHMVVAIHNDGPVTIMLDSQDRHRPRRSTLT